MKERGNRDEMVIATKFTSYYPLKRNDSIKVRANYQGQHAKSLHMSLEASLKKLQTNYIDLVYIVISSANFPVGSYFADSIKLYVHYWDFSTSIQEVMQSLNHVVASGKVLYLGISDTPAWVVSKANECKPGFPDLF